MSAIVTPSTLKKGLKALFMKEYGNGEDPKDVMPFIMETESDGADEEYGWLGESPNLSEWVDERKIKSLIDFEYKIKNKDYEATIGVDRNSIKDDKMGSIKTRIKDLAAKARLHPKKLFLEALKNGETELCYDGQPFFSASHEEGKSGAQSNIVTGGGVTLALIKADLEKARARMKSFKTDTGEPYNEGEIELAVICHPDLQSVFDDLNTLERIDGSTNGMRGKLKNIVVSSRLSDVNDYYVGDVSPGLKPFIQQNRQAPEFGGLEGDSEMGFMRKKWVYGVDMRMGFGYGIWQKMVKVKNA